MVKKVIKRKKEKYAFKPMKMNEVRGSQTHNIDGTEKKEKFSWKKHKVWLDSFRGTTIDSKEKERQELIKYARKQNKKRTY